MRPFDEPPSKAQQCRRNAYYCGMLARAADNARDRIQLLAMQRGWLALADRVPPSELRTAINDVRADCAYQAALGVGELVIGGPDGEVGPLRKWAESHGGALVLVAGPPELYARIDPWGTPPASLSLQKRIVQRFDPVRILNPGRLPGGI